MERRSKGKVRGIIRRPGGPLPLWGNLAPACLLMCTAPISSKRGLAWGTVELSLGFHVPGREDMDWPRWNDDFVTLSFN